MTEIVGDRRNGGATPTRRQMWRAAGGFALAATGLFVPAALDAAAEQAGSAEPERRRRPGKGSFRDSALTVVNKTEVSLNCTFYLQNRIGYDSYDPPVADGGARSIDPEQSLRYAPGQFRIGVLVTNVDPGVDLYADVRNVQLWYPRGGVSSGGNLDPSSGNIGNPFIREQNYAQGERHKKARIVLQRNDDSIGQIEWELIIGERRRRSR